MNRISAAQWAALAMGRPEQGERQPVPQPAGFLHRRPFRPPRRRSPPARPRGRGRRRAGIRRHRRRDHRSADRPHRHPAGSRQPAPLAARGGRVRARGAHALAQDARRAHRGRRDGARHQRVNVMADPTASASASAKSAWAAAPTKFSETPANGPCIPCAAKKKNPVGAKWKKDAAGVFPGHQSFNDCGLQASRQVIEQAKGKLNMSEREFMNNAIATCTVNPDGASSNGRAHECDGQADPAFRLIKRELPWIPTRRPPPGSRWPSRP